MAHSVSKTSAGFEGTGEIKFSQLRTTFLKKSTGSISASQLLRNTDTNLKSPIVPDCTENSGVAEYKISNGIITSQDWKVSQMRGLILRYEITQSGSDTDLNATGLAWNHNLGKNIPKIYEINGNITASLYTKDALTINQSFIVNLEVIPTGGSIKGAGGPGGGTWGQDSGGRGGNAFKFNSPGGKNNLIYIPSRSDIVIAGGGGGGGKGGDGKTGDEGAVWKPRVLGKTSQYTGIDDYNPGPWGEWYSYSIGGGVCDHPSSNDAKNYCYSDPSTTDQNRSRTIGNTTYNTRVYSINQTRGQIGAGTYASNRKGSGCSEKCKFDFFGIKLWCRDRGKRLGPAYCAVEDPVKAGGAPGGQGGNGGDGQGCDQEQSDGIRGTSGTSSAGNPNYATDGNDGKDGGDGGDWGEPGEAGKTDIKYENKWVTNPGILAWKVFKEDANGNYSDYYAPGYHSSKQVNSKEYMDLTYGISTDWASPDYDTEESNWLIKMWGWTDLMRYQGIYRSPIPGNNDKDPHINTWQTHKAKVYLESGTYKIRVESDNYGYIKIENEQNGSIPTETGFSTRYNNTIGDPIDREIIYSEGKGGETIEFYIMTSNNYIIETRVKNTPVSGATGSPGGQAGVAIYGTGYEVTEGTINSNNIRGEYRPDITNEVDDYVTITTTDDDGETETVTYNRAWRTTFKGIEYETVHEMSYSAGQTYLSLAQNVFTYVYQGTTIGTITVGTGQQEPVVSGDKRAKGGNRVIESNSWSEPSYYEIEVEQLKSYVAFEGNQLIHVYEGVNQGAITIGSGPDQQNYVENGGKRFYSGNLVIDNGIGNTNYYELEVQEYITITGE